MGRSRLPGPPQPPYSDDEDDYDDEEEECSTTDATSRYKIFGKSVTFLNEI